MEYAVFELVYATYKTILNILMNNEVLINEKLSIQEHVYRGYGNRNKHSCCLFGQLVFKLKSNASSRRVKQK